MTLSQHVGLLFFIVSLFFVPNGRKNSFEVQLDIQTWYRKIARTIPRGVENNLLMT